MTSLLERFSDLLQRHVHQLVIRGQRATGLAPCHDDRHPSFSADLSRGVWYCHACGCGGGVRDLARLVGEEWAATLSESRPARTRRARFQAEQQARTILQRRGEERHKALCADHREVYGEMLAAKDLLKLFHRRPDLVQEFSDLIASTEREYGDLLFKCTVLEAKLDGVVE